MRKLRSDITREGLARTPHRACGWVGVHSGDIAPKQPEQVDIRDRFRG